MTGAQRNPVAGRREADMTQHSPHIRALEPAPLPTRYDPMEDKMIAQRAYECWNERGCPNGSPEEDWYRAEREVRGHRGMLPPRIPD
jgi:hypothetical protein